MEGWQIDECLKSMQIVVDTREQPSKRAEKRYQSFNCPIYRRKLDYGDYAYDFSLDGKLYYSDQEDLKPPVVIERKEHLTELSGNLFQNRERFVREFDRAMAAGAKVYLLVEDASWENLINGRYRTKANPKAYFASITAFMARYDITPIFCKEETSGKLIREILYRELKERLEGGYYG